MCIPYVILGASFVCGPVYALVYLIAMGRRCELLSCCYDCTTHKDKTHHYEKHYFIQGTAHETKKNK